MLDKKTRQRIITDAETHTNEFEAQILGKPDTSNKESYLNGREDGYIAGASAEAERAQILVDALEKLRKHPRVTYQMQDIIDETLIKYNNPVK